MIFHPSNFSLSLSLSPSLRSFLPPCLFLSVSPFPCVSLFITLSLSLYLSIYLSLYRPFSLSLNISVPPSLSLSLSLSPSLRVQSLLWRGWCWHMERWQADDLHRYRIADFILHVNKPNPLVSCQFNDIQSSFALTAITGSYFTH